MRLDELTELDLIEPSLDGVDPVIVLRALATKVATATGLDAEVLYQRLDEREALGSTAIGHLVAVPHCRMEGVDDVVLAIGVAPAPIDFGGGDLGPVQLFFVVVAPASRPAAHLRCLQSISRWAKDGDRVERILKLDNAEAIYQLLGEADPTTP